MTDAAATFAALSSALRESRDRLRRAGRAQEDAAAAAARFERQVQRLSALAAAPADAGRRLNALQQVLDPQRLAAHVHAAVAAATIVDSPLPHALVEAMLPDDAYEALVAALPAEVFFDDPGNGRLELPMPPALAPLEAVVTGRVLTELAAEVIAPAAIKRFRDRLDRHARSRNPACASLDASGVRLVASQGRLLWRQPGFVPSHRRRHEWDFLTVIIFLAGDTRLAYGSVLHGDGPAVRVPGTPNSALIVLDPGGGHEYEAVPGADAGGSACPCYEFPIGPDTEGRRRLMV